jgi:hypothetical protein
MRREVRFHYSDILRAIDICMNGAETLEQAGIAWPIRNPLYLPSYMATHRTAGPGYPPQNGTTTRDFAAFAKPATSRGNAIQFSHWPSFSDMSMDNWSTEGSCYSVNDVTMPDIYPADPWDPINELDGNRRKNSTRQVLVTLRDDQLGQLVCPISLVFTQT